MNYSIVDWKLISFDLIRQFWDYLRKRGVWIKKKIEYFIITALNDTLNEKFSTPWTEKEIKKCNIKENFDLYVIKCLNETDFGRKSRDYITMIHSTSSTSSTVSSTTTNQSIEMVNQFTETIGQPVLIEENKACQSPLFEAHQARAPLSFTAKQPSLLKQQRLNAEASGFWNDPFSPKLDQTANTTTGITGHEKKIANLIRMYQDKTLKYSEENDSFTYKLSIVHDICDRVDISHEVKIKAFSIMWVGDALDYYYSHIGHESRATFDEICYIIRSYFETAKHKRGILFKWNDTTLKFIMVKTENKGKFMKECLQLLFKELRHLQHELDSEFRIDKFFHNKLINACQDISICQYACFNYRTISQA